ncbi:MAG TPA: hypothetical protein EYN69_02245 [Flavobacteriales bacterium]|nr:hypothetical protein [Flavobacteriales bacterium]
MLSRLFTISFLLLLFIGSSFGQSKKELLIYGDESFKNKNYVAAAYFYGKIIGSFASGEQDRVYPHGFSAWNRPLPKTEVADTSDIKSDSTDTEEKVERELAETVDSSDTSRPAQAFKGNESYQRAIYRLAESYRLSYNYLKAEAAYKKCQYLDFMVYPLAQFWYANSLKKNMKYGMAQQEYNDFMKKNRGNPALDTLGEDFIKKARKEMGGCRIAVNLIGDPVPGIKIYKADSNINTGSSNFAASFYNSDTIILFASARPGSRAIKNSDSEASSCDIYHSAKQDSAHWFDAKNFGNPINTVLQEGSPFISADGSKILFTRWGGGEENKDCHIYVSRFFNGQWLQPQKLNDNVNIPGYKSMHPYLMPDGDILIFSSNRPGGRGKMDLWYCEIDDFGNASSPINFDYMINTRENEVSPFYVPGSQSLFFSSDGHAGMGGHDIFESYGALENLGRPQNLGVPVNSSRDDMYFILNENETSGYMTSDRAECVDCETGSCPAIYAVDYGPPKFTLSGYVYSKLDKVVIPNALLTFKDVSDDYEPFFIVTDENGYFFTPLRRELTYYIKAQKVRYFADARTITTVGLTKSTDMVKNFYLPKIPIGEIAIEGIYYDYDKWDLRPESETTLDSLVYFLNVNNNITIELSSHTDDRGQENYNLKLSQRRAQSVVDYLIKKGIDIERLTPVGYGKSKPVIENAETEEEHQKNRRTAFEVLRQDYIKINKKK